MKRALEYLQTFTVFSWNHIVHRWNINARLQWKTILWFKSKSFWVCSSYIIIWNSSSQHICSLYWYFKISHRFSLATSLRSILYHQLFLFCPCVLLCLHFILLPVSSSQLEVVIWPIVIISVVTKVMQTLVLRWTIKSSPSKLAAALQRVLYNDLAELTYLWNTKKNSVDCVLGQFKCK